MSAPPPAAAGEPFEEQGLEGVVDPHGWGSAKELGWAAFAAVEHHTREKRLLDDLTGLVARTLPPLPVTAVAETAAVGV